MLILKTFLKKITPRKMIEFYRSIKKRFFISYANRSYSQEGEDMILRRIFERQKKGYYVDVGAHHPKRFSNTYYFYKYGWNGINIDAQPGSMNLFKKIRPRDINIELPISNKIERLKYYVFNESALSSFSKKLSEERNQKNNNYKIVKVIEIYTDTLENVLNKYLPIGQTIDFLSIDVEGHDYAVLLSNNWEKFRPKYVLVEILGKTIDDVKMDKINIFMEKNNYSLYAKCVNTVFYKDGFC